jgi:hypothetical protein
MPGSFHSCNAPRGVPSLSKTGRPAFVDYPTGQGVVRLRVVALEYLRRTSDTLRLLSLPAQHPGARVEANPAASGATPGGP